MGCHAVSTRRPGARGPSGAGDDPRGDRRQVVPSSGDRGLRRRPVRRSGPRSATSCGCSTVTTSGWARPPSAPWRRSTSGSSGDSGRSSPADPAAPDPAAAWAGTGTPSEAGAHRSGLPRRCRRRPPGGAAGLHPPRSGHGGRPRSSSSGWRRCHPSPAPDTADAGPRKRRSGAGVPAVPARHPPGAGAPLPPRMRPTHTRAPRRGITRDRGWISKWRSRSCGRRPTPKTRWNASTRSPAPPDPTTSTMAVASEPRSARALWRRWCPSANTSVPVSSAVSGCRQWRHPVHQRAVGDGDLGSGRRQLGERRFTDRQQGSDLDRGSGLQCPRAEGGLVGKEVRQTNLTDQSLVDQSAGRRHLVAVEMGLAGAPKGTRGNPDRRLVASLDIPQSAGPGRRLGSRHCRVTGYEQCRREGMQHG